MIRSSNCAKSGVGGRFGAWFGLSWATCTEIFRVQVSVFNSVNGEGKENSLKRMPRRVPGVGTDSYLPL